MLFDCSNRSETIYDDAGILSFEMNHAKQRIFANCGYYKNLDTPMYNACKNTAAHNTITVNNYNALSIGNRSRITKVKGSLINDKGWSLLQGSHDGFEKITNSLLKRVIAINENGTEIIGEDSFELLVGIHDITSRFHLHPDVKVSILSSKHEAMLQVGKQGWKFKIEGGKLSLQPSFFVDAQGNSRKTNQLVFETKSISQYVTMRWHISLQ
ncbi:MAG: heparinase II/III family protein [Alphaproteobacteria bacterium]